MATDPKLDPKTQDNDNLDVTDPEEYWEDCIGRAIEEYLKEKSASEKSDAPEAD